MNKQRRKKLEQISGALTNLYWDLLDVKEEEEMAFDNLPDSLKESKRGQQMEEGIYTIDDWMYSLEDIYSAIDDFVGV